MGFFPKIVNGFEERPYHIETSLLICYVNQWTNDWDLRQSD